MISMKKMKDPKDFSRLKYKIKKTTANKKKYKPCFEPQQVKFG